MGHLTLRLSGQAPVDGRSSGCLESLIGATEGAGTEETPGRRQRARMHAGNLGDPVEHRRQTLSVTPPQHRNEWSASSGEAADGRLGHLLPSLSAMRCRLTGLHRQHPVEQQDAASSPRGEVAAGWRRKAEVS
jgi:hypothetical protein